MYAERIDREVAVHRANCFQDFSIFAVTPQVHARSIQEVAWGRGPSANHIFATSGLDDYDVHDAQSFIGGYHKSFDIISKEPILELPHERSGEALAVNPQGGLHVLVKAYILIIIA